MATIEEMNIAGDEALAELRKKMADDAEFAKAVAMVGAWLSKWYVKAGYKRLCRGLLNIIK